MERDELSSPEISSCRDWEPPDYAQTLDAVLASYEDVKAGRTRPAADFLEELRLKYGFPR